MSTDILLLDDDKFMQKFIKNILSLKYNVHCFGTINDASSFLEKNSVDVIITDLNLKGESGATFIYEVKENNLFAHIPIITLSGEDKAKVKTELQQFDIAAFISKPFTPDILFKTIGEVISPNPNSNAG